MQNTNGIVKTFNENDFISEFRLCDRKDNFSYKGLCILFESLEQTAQDCGINIEIDVIALCCEYNEDSIADIINNYDIDLSHCHTMDDRLETVEEYLQDNTYVCGSYDDDEHDKVFIYQAF